MTATSKTGKTPKPLTGWHVLAYFAALFGVMFAVNFYFTFKAVTTFPGEQTEKSYLQGLEYNDVLEARQTQRALGWTAQIGIETGAVADELVVRIADSRDEPVTGLDLEATMTRPSSDADQMILALSAVGDGFYRVELPTLNSGVWKSVVASTSAEQPFEAHKTLHIR